ncbi:MAG: cysteine desulfurase family protein, partial [Sandaracinaceae bacterium]
MNTTSEGGAQRPLYLDHHATTPLDARVLDAMMPFLTTDFGNAASRTHRYGWDADKAVQYARAQVGKLIGRRGKEVVFTSGATESNNLALRGVMDAHPDGHLITVATEHRAVLDMARHLEQRGVELTVLPVDGEGRVSPDAVRAAIRPNTRLISVMWVN